MSVNGDSTIHCNLCGQNYYASVGHNCDYSKRIYYTTSMAPPFQSVPDVNAMIEQHQADLVRIAELETDREQDLRTINAINAEIAIAELKLAEADKKLTKIRAVAGENIPYGYTVDKGLLLDNLRSILAILDGAMDAR